MVIGSPRSGTAWAANWLGAVHDPLFDYFYTDLDELDAGICCTGLGMFHRWVNGHPAPKVILHRDPRQVEVSLRRMNLPMCGPEIFTGLDRIVGLHVPWDDLFYEPERIWRHLMPTAFDAARHNSLKNVNIQCDWSKRRTPRRVRQQYARVGVIVGR